MDKKEALEIVKKEGDKITSLPENFQKDREIFLEAVKQDGSALNYADDSLKNDPDILAIVNKKKKFK